jgi:hypothetical protein
MEQDPPTSSGELSGLCSKLQLAGAEDRATQGCDLSADPGAEVGRERAPLAPPLKDPPWQQSDKSKPALATSIQALPRNLSAPATLASHSSFIELLTEPLTAGTPAGPSAILERSLWVFCSGPVPVVAGTAGRKNPPLLLVPWCGGGGVEGRWGIEVSGTAYPALSHLWKTCDHQVSR